MKLTAFNIQNYRSIIHSGWCSLAHDNITALIGQNESGKTSILEALHSFYIATINEDILRSDLSLPIVSCKFILGKGNLIDYFDKNRLPDDLVDIFIKCKEIELTRSWKSDRSSMLFISNEDILNYYEKKEVEKAALEEKTQIEIKKLLEQSEAVINEMQAAEQDKNEAQEKLNAAGKRCEEYRKKLKKAKKDDQRVIAEGEYESANKEYKSAEDNFTEKVGKYDEIRQKTEELSEKVWVCKACIQSVDRVRELKQLIETYLKRQKELEHQHEISSIEKDQRSALQKLQQLNADLETGKKKYQEALDEEDMIKVIAIKVLSGIGYRAAEVEAKLQLSQEKKLYTIFEMGSVIMEKCPVFEFFEDFSSLLPNKIDLEDIINENQQTEGYKASRSFLSVAGLDSVFFREKNHRILKQKIENLNTEITINFHDYWSQHVGKDSKIRLNFELEHYDYTHPEKSGKPYLEFWIKDNNERLYPKQRSRGVRWFLSFYLELKAAAKNQNISRIILIDEPGLSLHARAQEDVLKVFEDLKESMQIIYCTHSPHLIDMNKLYRILAVQRADELDDRSETVIFDPASLHSASSDTLSPVYTLMGLRVNNQDFIKSGKNIIVEDTLTYYYLNIFSRMLNYYPEYSFIPSTGLTTIPVLANILLGWRVDFSVLLLGVNRPVKVIQELSDTLFFNKKDELDKKVVRIDDFEYPEDVFSTLDFKKFLLQRREGITEKNSQYIIEQGLSRTILASQFINVCESKNLNIKDFDTTTQENIRKVLSFIDPAISGSAKK